jgi:hemerythrin-like domain-containing protein
MDARRRHFLSGSAILGGAALLGACSKKESPPDAPHLTGAAQAAQGTQKKTDEHDDKDEKDEKEVGPTEDLMREHGVLRRVLVVYRESATRLRTHQEVPPDALHKSARLFRAFGEEYHEKRVEEADVFPAVRAAGGPLATLVGELLRQHDRGREITDWILAKTTGPKIGASADQVAKVLDSFARMYEAHTAREDTIAFPAWKDKLSGEEIHELGEKFEEIEKQQFGHDGFEDAVKQIDAIEGSLGLGDLAIFDAPPPPKA